jgi:hypothetical protein
MKEKEKNEESKWHSSMMLFVFVFDVMGDYWCDVNDDTYEQYDRLYKN